MTEANLQKEKKQEYRINFEGAWKELVRELDKSSPIDLYKTIRVYMAHLEKKHKNIIDIKRVELTADLIDKCVSKRVQCKIENIHLKKNLREANKEIDKLKEGLIAGSFGHMMDNAREAFRCMPFPRDIRCVQVKVKPKLCNIKLVGVTDNLLEIALNLDVTEKKHNYYRKALEEGEEISWHGLKMKILEVILYLPSRENPKIVDVKRRDTKCV